MSSKVESWKRLAAEDWCKNPRIASMNDPTAQFMKRSEGSLSTTYDEYAVSFSKMPDRLTPEEYLLKFAQSPNEAVISRTFNAINVFKKRRKSAPTIGDIYDIDIAGPDNGSIVLVALSSGFGVTTGSAWFDIQTISCKKYGTHPECGAREFGFEYLDDRVKFYTRGVSRPYMKMHKAGAPAQKLGWTSMMEGIRHFIEKQGGQFVPGSISSERKSAI